MSDELIALQLAQTAPELHELDPSRWAMEPKLDGVRVGVRKRGDDVTVYSRVMKEFTAQVPHLVSTLREIPTDFDIDGELIAPTGRHIYGEHTLTRSDLGRVTGTLNSLPDTARVNQERNGYLTLCVFDTLTLMNQQLWPEPDARRRLFTEYLVRAAESPFLEVVPRFDAWSCADEKALIELDFEGVMMKDLEAAYRPGKRVKAWGKRKLIKTADVVVTGYTKGQGKFDGMIGAITYGQVKDGIVVARGQCSGMTDEVRQFFTDHGSAFVGRVMEIRYFGFVGDSTTAQFRHPQYVRMRDDKLAEDCEWTT